MDRAYRRRDGRLAARSAGQTFPDLCRFGRVRTMNKCSWIVLVLSLGLAACGGGSGGGGGEPEPDAVLAGTDFLSHTPGALRATGSDFTPVGGNATFRLQATAGTPFLGNTTATLEITGTVESAQVITAPVLAAASAASVPAWPPPTTMTSKSTITAARAYRTASIPLQNLSQYEQMAAGLLADTKSREYLSQQVVRGVQTGNFGQ